jgi:hypothetical protein
MGFLLPTPARSQYVDSLQAVLMLDLQRRDPQRRSAAPREGIRSTRGNGHVVAMAKYAKREHERRYGRFQYSYKYRHRGASKKWKRFWNRLERKVCKSLVIRTGGEWDQLSLPQPHRISDLRSCY